jgi:hypothetical protein
MICHWKLYVWPNSLQTLIWIWSHFVLLTYMFSKQTPREKLILSSSFKCGQIHYCQRYDFAHSLMCHLGLTWVINKPGSILSLLKYQNSIYCYLSDFKLYLMINFFFFFFFCKNHRYLSKVDCLTHISLWNINFNKTRPQVAPTKQGRPAWKD